MSDEYKKEVELYQKGLINNFEAGVVKPIGAIYSVDNKIQSVVLKLKDKSFTLQLKYFSGTKNQLTSELLKLGLTIQDHEIKDFKKLVTRCLHIENEKLLRKYILPERNGFIDERLIFIDVDKIHANNNELTSNEEFLSLPLPFELKKVAQHKGSKELYQKVILNDEAPHFIVFAVLIGLSGSLLDLVNIDGGGFHVFGPSGVGKTILLMITASVRGNPRPPDKGGREQGVMMSWGTTKNGIEAKYYLYNNDVLILDELSKYSSKTFTADVYAIAGGAYKARMGQNLESIEPEPVSFMLLSSGELSMQSMIERLREPKLGQGKSVRMPGISLQDNDINFPEIYSSNEEAAQLYEKTVSENYGFLLNDFLEKLVNFKSSYCELKTEVRALLDSTYEELKNSLPCNSSIEARVMKRFALLSVAGQLGKEFGVLQWDKEKITEAISYVYKRFYDYDPNRHSDAELAFNFIKFKLQSEQGNFIQVKTSIAPNKHFGYVNNTHFYIYPEVFKRWLKSASESMVINMLKQLDLLKHEPDRNTLRTTEHLPDKANNRRQSATKKNRETFYCISRSIISVEID
ncbi:DUF927 domain-containing protein [Tenacibaculum sp.]|uniref:DUF927 domain-containing protein n=1 Tax=Tenacibaculum sp. TaxID=1906242 RepID=UPI003AA8F129